MEDKNKIFKATIICSNSCYTETVLVIAKNEIQAHGLLCSCKEREVEYKNELKEIIINIDSPSVISNVGFGENDHDWNFDD